MTAASTAPLPPFALERYFGPREFTAPFMLGASDCESLTVNELLALVPGARDELLGQWLGYTETEGAPILREAISRLYETVRADDILVHNGAGEAIFTFMHAALRPGDRVVVHYPCYQSLHDVARSAGAVVSRWEARAASGWELDLEELARLVTPRTRAIVVNVPHNPTGYVMDGGAFEALLQVARRHGAYLFCDEVYRGLEYDPAWRLPAACDRYERAVSLGVMSKSYGLPGLRIGWAATRDRALRDRMLEIKDYTTLCCGAPSELLARVALNAGARILERNREIVRGNLAALRSFLARHADRLRWAEPRGGPVGFPSLVRDDDPSAFCETVLAEAGVLLVPGTVFDAESREIRIGFGRRGFPEGLARLDAYLS